MEGSKSFKLSDLVVRDMRSDDLNDVVAIERNAHVSPWSRLSFEESLTRSEESLTKSEKSLTRSEESSAPYRCRVVEHHTDILAYHILSQVADELHILNIVVSPSMQSNGLGHLLMQDILAIAQDCGLKKLFLEVRASNQAAQGLYKKWQFEQIAVRKAYYAASKLLDNAKREDALVFLRQIN